MSKQRILAAIAICGLAWTLPAAASGPTVIGDIGASARAQAGDQLKACAADQGINVDGEASFLTSDESTMAFMPVAGIEALKREDLVAWTVLGVFSAQGPSDSEAPSGNFRVEVRADIGTTHGEFRVIDEAGRIVQQGETLIDTDPDGTPPGVAANGLAGRAPIDGKGYYFGTFFCPWYYPYFTPYFFRYWPIYKHGCYWWYNRWWWGYLHFRYCWWPSRYCVNCRHYW